MKHHLERSEPLHSQVTRLIREKILSHELPAGSRIPPASELAVEYGTNSFTIHTALVPLVKEGLIERRPRVGSFVRDRRPVASMVIGVYCCQSFWQLNHLGFVRAVQDALRKKLNKSGHQIKIWIDSRPPKEQKKPLPELARAIQEREIQGLAVLLANHTDLQWLKKLTLPISLISSAMLPNTIRFDHRQFLQLSLDRLQAQGCRTVGLIAGLNNVDAETETGVQHPWDTFYEDYLALCQERGLEIRNQWMLAPNQDLDENHELFGYTQFQKLWRGLERPEGLVAYPDCVALGVAKGLAELGPGSAVPHLAFHRNRGVSLPFPAIAANWVSLDVNLVADGLLLQILQQAGGKPAPAVTVPYDISKHEELP